MTKGEKSTRMSRDLLGFVGIIYSCKLLLDRALESDNVRDANKYVGQSVIIVDNWLHDTFPNDKKDTYNELFGHLQENIVEPRLQSLRDKFQGGLLI